MHHFLEYGARFRELNFVVTNKGLCVCPYYFLSDEHYPFSGPCLSGMLGAFVLCIRSFSVSAKGCDSEIGSHIRRSGYQDSPFMEWKFLGDVMLCR